MGGTEAARSGFRHSSRDCESRRRRAGQHVARRIGAAGQVVDAYLWHEESGRRDQRYVGLLLHHGWPQGWNSLTAPDKPVAFKFELLISLHDESLRTAWMSKTLHGLEITPSRV